MVFQAESYWLKNAHVPNCLMDLDDCRRQTREGLCLVDLKISHGEIEQVIAAKAVE